MTCALGYCKKSWFKEIKWSKLNSLGTLYVEKIEVEIFSFSSCLFVCLCKVFAKKKKNLQITFKREICSNFFDYQSSVFMCVCARASLMYGLTRVSPPTLFRYIHPMDIRFVYSISHSHILSTSSALFHSLTLHPFRSNSILISIIYRLCFFFCSIRNVCAHAVRPMLKNGYK